MSTESSEEVPEEIFEEEGMGMVSLDLTAPEILAVQFTQDSVLEWKILLPREDQPPSLLEALLPFQNIFSAKLWMGRFILISPIYVIFFEAQLRVILHSGVQPSDAIYVAKMITTISSVNIHHCPWLQFFFL